MKNRQDTVTTQVGRLGWLLDLIRSDTLAVFNGAEDKASEFALLDFCHILAEADLAIRRRHEGFLEEQGHE